MEERLTTTKTFVSLRYVWAWEISSPEIPPTSRGILPVTRASTTFPISPGRGCKEATASLERAVLMGESSIILTPRFLAASLRRINNVPYSSLRSGVRRTTVLPGEHISDTVALGKPSRTCGGSSSPRSALTWSVPITPFASFAHAYWDSFVNLEPPITPTRSGSVPFKDSVIMLIAPAHDAATRPVPDLSALLRPPPRTKGLSNLYSLWKASKEKRSLSHSQPQLTSSLSNPCRRKTWSRDD